jgi:hypothetical protein
VICVTKGKDSTTWQVCKERLESVASSKARGTACARFQGTNPIIIHLINHEGWLHFVG